MKTESWIPLKCCGVGFNGQFKKTCQTSGHLSEGVTLEENSSDLTLMNWLNTTHKKLEIFDCQMKFQNAPEKHSNLNLTFSKPLNAKLSFTTYSSCCHPTRWLTAKITISAWINTKCSGSLKICMEMILFRLLFTFWCRETKMTPNDRPAVPGHCGGSWHWAKSVAERCNRDVKKSHRKTKKWTSFGHIPCWWPFQCEHFCFGIPTTVVSSCFSWLFQTFPLLHITTYDLLFWYNITAATAF